MELELEQKDALTELIHIGYGRAANALSELTGYRISLAVSQLAIYNLDLVAPKLEELLGSSVATVTQAFSGPFAGNALLLLDERSALLLSGLLSEGAAEPRTFDSNAREIITEVGNILLNACLGAFGNLLKIQVNFAVPRMVLDNSGRFVEAAVATVEEPLTSALMVHTHFKVKGGDITGYMVIVLGINSLDRLMQGLDDWESRQLQ